MFNVPKNIQDGQSIRISGKGNKGEAGGADGDLIIRIQVKADENIIVKGNDLYYKQEITFPEAVLGDRKQIPPLKGIETCTIPLCTSSGQKFCMKNRGLTDDNGNTGHQYVVIKIIIPKAETKEQINLLKKVQQKLY